MLGKAKVKIEEHLGKKRQSKHRRIYVEEKTSEARDLGTAKKWFAGKLDFWDMPESNGWIVATMPHFGDETSTAQKKTH